MATTARSKTQGVKQATPWWQAAGDQQCAHCGQLYLHELEYRCPECDEPSCRHCRCPQCASNAADQSHGR